MTIDLGCSIIIQPSYLDLFEIFKLSLDSNGFNFAEELFNIFCEFILVCIDGFSVDIYEHHLVSFLLWLVSFYCTVFYGKK